MNIPEKKLLIKNYLNYFERLILYKICRRLVKQGYTHDKKVAAYFAVMRDCVEHEFTEDTKVGIDCFLQECLDKSLS